MHDIRSLCLLVNSTKTITLFAVFEINHFIYQLCGKHEPCSEEILLNNNWSMQNYRNLFVDGPGNQHCALECRKNAYIM